ncbi:MAG: FAD-dependent oxidoreductase [Eubacteriales bacterium]|nr:FAD-dependent oxidoreductase [Eubacteriales bacterium]
MSKRILVIGGVAGGASTAARARRLDESAEVVMFEKGPHVSFSNCCLPFYLSRIVPESDNLVLMDPEQFKKQYNIDALVDEEVVAINREQKTVSVQSKDGKVREEAYDILMLSPGANPIMPGSIKGLDKPHVFTVRNVVDIVALDEYVREVDAKNVVIVGGGFVGLEVMENLRLADRNVTLVEAMDQIMTPFDYDMAQILHKEIYDQGVNLMLSEQLVEVADKEVILASGKKLPADVVVMSIGVRPETKLAQDCGLEIGETGAIKVNHNYQTSDPNIYAVGDAVEVNCFFTGAPTKLAMAGPAQRQARAAAGHFYGRTHRNTGVIGSSVVRIFDYNAARTGFNEKQAQRAGIPYDYVYLIPGDKVGLMPGCHPLFFKLIFETPSGRILGAQAIGKGAVDKRIDVIATLIMMHGTLEDLAELELCYSPAYGTAKDVVNHAALVALNILNCEFKQIPVTEVRRLVEEKAFIIDVREPEEYALSHLKTAVNIPMSEFRQRLDEIPKDQPVYVHCRSSQRSYNVARALGQLGFDNIYNIMGSYLGISFYEYFNDKITGREPIVTDYNFN